MDPSKLACWLVSYSVGMQTVVVIPAHQEASSLPALLDELAELRPELGAVVVDDASTDRSVSVLASLDVDWLGLEQRLGVGGAMRAGLRWAVRKNASRVIRLDGDGQHPPSEIVKLERALDDGARAAVGTRTDFLAGAWWRRCLLFALASSLSLLTRRRVLDPSSGFWAFDAEVARHLADHHPRGYGEAELRLYLHRSGIAVAQVPVSMRPRRYGRSSLRPLRLSSALLRTMLALAVEPLRPKKRL